MRHLTTRLSIFSMTLIPAALSFGAEPVDGHAADAGHAEPGLMDFDLLQFAMAIIVFGIAFFVLSKTAWPKIIGGLEAREGKIKGDIAEAERARGQAESALAQYEKALAEARSEAARIVDEARSNQLAIAAELKSKTEKELADMRDSAKRDIASAKSAAISELHAHVADLSTEIAGKILKRELSANDQRSLVDDSLSRLATAAPDFAARSHAR